MNVRRITTQPISVLTIISQHIWIKIGIVLVSSSSSKNSAKEGLYANTYIRRANWRFQTVEPRRCYRFGAGGVPGGGGVSAGAALCVGQGRCTCPLCLQRVCGFFAAPFGEEGAGHFGYDEVCRVSLYRSLHLCMPRKLNTPLLLFSDLGAWFLNEIFRFLYCGARKAFLAILAIFNGRRMSDCSSCTRPPCLAIVARHVENLQDISQCF